MFKSLIYISLIMFAMFGCSKDANIKEDNKGFTPVKEYVSTLKNKQNLLILVLELEKNILNLQKEFKLFLVDTKKMLKNYDTKRVDLDIAHEKWLKRRMFLENNLIDIHFDMKEVVSDKEFIKIQKLLDDVNINMRIN